MQRLVAFHPTVADAHSLNCVQTTFQAGLSTNRAAGEKMQWLPSQRERELELAGWREDPRLLFTMMPVNNFNQSLNIKGNITFLFLYNSCRS